MQQTLQYVYIFYLSTTYRQVNIRLLTSWCCKKKKSRILSGPQISVYIDLVFEMELGTCPSLFSLHFYFSRSKWQVSFTIFFLNSTCRL